MRISLPADFPLHIHSWGAEHVVYHSGSGNTHLLDEYGFRVLDAVKQGRHSVAAIATFVADNLQLEESGDFTEHMLDVIDQLNKHSLVEIEVVQPRIRSCT